MKVLIAYLQFYVTFQPLYKSKQHIIFLVKYMNMVCIYLQACTKKMFAPNKTLLIYRKFFDIVFEIQYFTKQILSISNNTYCQ